MLVYRRVLETRQEKDVNCSKLLRCWCWDILEALRKQKMERPLLAHTTGRIFKGTFDLRELLITSGPSKTIIYNSGLTRDTICSHFPWSFDMSKMELRLRTTKTYCKKRGQRAAPGSPEHSSSRILRCRPLQALGSMCDDVPDFPPRVSPSFPPTHSRGIMRFFFWLAGRRVTG